LGQSLLKLKQHRKFYPIKGQTINYPEVLNVEILIRLLKGAAIGIAMLVPGVSGGTMAIILGVYDDMIHSVSSFFKDIKKNFVFLLNISLGGIIGVLAFSKLIEYALENFRHPTMYFFIGIVIGGIPVLYQKAVNSGNRKKQVKNWIFFVLGFVIVLIMSIYNGTIVNLANSTGVLHFIFLFIAGIVISVALILPGISTSFMLLVLGMYDITIKAINNLYVSYLAPIAIGLAFGVIATAKILENAMQKKPSQTYMLILGFVVGSIVPVFPGLPEQTYQIIISAVVFVIGFVIIRFMSKKFAD
jgi:putative membrane protein